MRPAHQAGAILEEEPHALVLGHTAVHRIFVLKLVALLDLSYVWAGRLDQPTQKKSGQELEM